MKFLCLAFGDQQKMSALTESEIRTIGEKCRAYDEELQKNGRLVAGASLDWGAKTMRLRGGKLKVTDGPFTEAKELVGGLVIIEAADYDEAIRIASLHPAARMGEELGWGIELRPIDDCQLKKKEES
jgi:hypothetical protein